jgi:methionyl-tRNA synthetase
LKWGGLEEGNAIGEVKAIFPRLDKDRIMEEIKNQAATPADTAVTAPAAEATSHHATQADAVGVTSLIEIDDFAKVDLRVGQVVSAERIPKADKLLLMKIDIGEEQPRQVLAGIAQYYEPEKLINRKVVVVANLKPRQLRGLESQGMVVAASYGEEGQPVIATFTEDVPNGARLK